MQAAVFADQPKIGEEVQLLLLQNELEEVLGGVSVAKKDIFA